MEKEQIRISAKNLGQLALPDYCPRCFWLKLKLQFKLPYQIFPGIFSSIDSYSKKITWSYYHKYGVVPPWFQPFGEFIRPIPVPHFNKYFIFRDGQFLAISYSLNYRDNDPGTEQRCYNVHAHIPITQAFLEQLSVPYAAESRVNTGPLPEEC